VFSYKKTSHLFIQKKLTSDDATGSFHSALWHVHKNNKPLKADKNRLWFLKQNYNHLRSLKDVIAQEFIRLIIPANPKTRFVCESYSTPEPNYIVDPKKIPGVINYESYYVMSKAVPGFISLRQFSQAEIVLHIKSGKWHGMGEIILLSFFLDDNDVRLDNVCVNNEGRILRIDGDCALDMLEVGYRFSHHLHKEILYFLTLAPLEKIAAIHAADIQQLPRRSNNERWLLDNKFKRDAEGNISKEAYLGEQLASISVIQTEMDKAILKLLLLPKSLVSRFLKYYVPVEELKLIDKVFDIRLTTLASAVASRTSFFAYVASESAKNDMENFILQLQAFKPYSDYKLLQEVDVSYIRKKFDVLHELQEFTQPELASPSRPAL